MQNKFNVGDRVLYHGGQGTVRNVSEDRLFVALDLESYPVWLPIAECEVVNQWITKKKN